MPVYLAIANNSKEAFDMVISDLSFLNNDEKENFLKEYYVRNQYELRDKIESQLVWSYSKIME